MRAAVYRGPGDIDVEDVADPTVEVPTDALVRVVAAGVCGSDLWTYRGQGTAAPGARIGHEFVGEVVETGTQVTGVRPGDWVVAPFRYSCGACRFCTTGLPSSCPGGGFWSREVVTGGQGQTVRVPLADGTLVKALPDGSAPDPGLVPGLLTLTDVLCTGYHAALGARVTVGSTVVVVGDGAVGLCAVVAARLRGADRVLLLGSTPTHPARTQTARRLGADEIVTVRGADAVAQVMDLTAGVGAPSVLECVGTAQSFATALDVVAPGGAVGWVGLPHGVDLDLSRVFARNITLAGGIAPVRAYIPTLLPDVLAGTVDPGVVFTDTLGLSEVARAYRLLDTRQTVKPLLDPTR
ncbi:MAG: alcohol dehydrogenase catalytic domain-containing protein [Micrococcales bacterium]|nr:alcohol dehydrogenase catalytic domain-containing protein [Micrococcales bacterium]